MASMQEAGLAPTVHFKRRKTAHAKRVYVEKEPPTASDSHPDDAASPPSESREEDNAVPNLKDILRNRKRPRNRPKDTARKTEAPRGDMAAADMPRDTQYTGRFVAQTGQVVDRDDKQM
jgi:hypothetical protein